MSAVVRAALLLAVAGALVAMSAGPARAATVTVPMGENSIYGPYWFCDASHSGNVCTTTIVVGDTVTWQNNTFTSHTVTECDGNCGVPNPPSPLWDSGLIAYGGTFSRQFNQAGTFNYQCNVHPDQMKGQIIVQAGGPTATSTAKPTPSPTPPPPVGGIAIDPGGSRPPLGTARGSSTGPTALQTAAGATAAALMLAGLAWRARRLLRRSS